MPSGSGHVVRHAAIILVMLTLAGCTTTGIPVPAGGEAPALPPYQQTIAGGFEEENSARTTWGADCVMESARRYYNESRQYEEGNRESKDAAYAGDREDLDGYWKPSNNTVVMNVGDEDWVRMTFMADNETAKHTKKIALVLRSDEQNPDYAQLAFTGGETVYRGPFEGNQPVHLEAKVQAISEGYANTGDAVWAVFYTGAFGYDAHHCRSIPYYVNKA